MSGMFDPQKYCFPSGARFGWKLFAVRDGVSEPYELTADSVHGFDAAFFALLAREGWKANGLPQEDEHEYRYPDVRLPGSRLFACRQGSLK